jgi:membrane protein
VVDTVLTSIPLAQDSDRTRLQGTLRDALDAAGSLGPFTVLLLIAGGSGVMSALRHAINQAWDIHARPPLLRRKALDVALILGATVILAASLSITATRRAANLLDDEAGGGWLAAGVLDFIGDALPFLFVTGVIAFLYRILPMHRPRLRDVWPGALVATALLALVRGALEIYFENFADLGALYGSLGALMALLLFVYAAANVIVFGAEVASEWGRLPDDEEIGQEVARGRQWVRAKLRR